MMAVSDQNEFVFGHPELLRKRTAVIFPIGYAGAIYKCVITSEVLKDCFDASPSDLLESYEKNKDIINEIVKKILSSGEMAPGDEILITTEIFRKIKG
jgi:hypothetical protein